MHKNHCYLSCHRINNFNLCFNGRVDKGGKIVALCCEMLNNIPAIKLSGTGKQIIDNFVFLRESAIKEGHNHAQSVVVTEGCLNCVNWQYDDWKDNGLVRFVNFSMYPAPCDCRCIYCVYRNDIKEFNDLDVIDGYEKVFEAVKYAEDTGLIAQDALWQISSGEITVHPFKKRFIDITKNKNTDFFTNCFVYDEGIGLNLASNPMSSINLSIDAGTRETWFKIKGFDNFDVVLENLQRYYEDSMQDGQLTFKYIILPGINDNESDFQNVVSIMKCFGVKKIHLSRDNRIKYSGTGEQYARLVNSLGIFLSLLYKNEMHATMYSYSLSERREAEKIAQKSKK